MPALFLLLTVLGCTGTSPGDAPASATPRIVSLAPAMTETVVRLGATEQLVGRTEWCTPPQVQQLPVMGSALTPNLEAIVSVNPTVVLIESAAGADLATVGELAPIEPLPWLTVDDVAKSTERIGEITGRVDEGRALAQRYRTELQIDPPAAGREVLLVIGTEGPGEVWYIRRNSLHGAALHAAGGKNAIDEDIAGAPSLSPERLVALDPDTIVLLASRPLDDAQEQAAIDKWAAMETLSAVQNGRVLVHDADNIMGPGPGVLDLASALRGLLAP